MKVNLNLKLKTLEGVVMLMDPTDKKSEASLKKLIPQILLGTYPGETITAEEKLHRYKISEKVVTCQKGDIELEAEDIVLIKKLGGIGLDTLSLGQLHKNLPK